MVSSVLAHTIHSHPCQRVVPLHTVIQDPRFLPYLCSVSPLKITEVKFLAYKWSSGYSMEEQKLIALRYVSSYNSLGRAELQSHTALGRKLESSVSGRPATSSDCFSTTINKQEEDFWWTASDSTPLLFSVSWHFPWWNGDHDPNQLRLLWDSYPIMPRVSVRMCSCFPIEPAKCIVYFRP